MLIASKTTNEVFADVKCLRILTIKNKFTVEASRDISRSPKVEHNLNGIKIQDAT